MLLLRLVVRYLEASVPRSQSYAGLTVSEAWRLKELEAENSKLKELLAEAEARQIGAEGSAPSKMARPQARRQAVDVLRKERLDSRAHAGWPASHGHCTGIAASMCGCAVKVRK